MDNLTLSIVSHGHGPLLTQLLDDLQRLGPIAHNVVLTLNLRDEVVDTARWPGLSIQVLRNEQPQGFGANHNAAFAHCRSRWFAVLNPDLRLTSDPFSPLITQAANTPNIGVIAPRIVDSRGHTEDSVRENLTPWSVLKRARAGQVTSGVVDPQDGRGMFYWLAGMFLMFSADAYRKLQGFDERFFLYCEDYDICARLHLAGFALAHASSVVAIHDAQRDSRRSIGHLRLHVTSLLKVWTSSAFWRVVLNRKPSPPHLTI